MIRYFTTILALFPAFVGAQENITVEWIYGQDAENLTSVPDFWWTSKEELIVRDPLISPSWLVVNPKTGGKAEWFNTGRALNSLQTMIGAYGKDLPWPEGITATGNAAVFLFNGDVFLLNPTSSSFQRVTQTVEEEKSPRFSPDGSKLAYVRANNLYVFDTKTGQEMPLTTDGSETTLNGTLSWLYWEEIFDREDLGFWWSVDSKHIAYLQTDESNVSVTRWVDFKPAIPREILQRYPKTGGVNPTVRVGVVPALGGPTTWLRPDSDQAEYIGRVWWHSSGDRLMVQTMSRDQMTSELFLAEAATGKCSKIITETDPGWVNFHDDLLLMKGGKSFLWKSERSGFAHLYKVQLDGSIQQLTTGSWSVRPSGGKSAIAYLDENGGWVYFTSMQKSSVERHLYRISMDGRKMERISMEPGTHKIHFSPNGSYYIDVFSSHSTLPELQLRTAGGKKLQVLSLDRSNRLKGLNIQFPSLLQIPARDGFLMPAQIMKPANFDSTKAYPLIVSVYGGPSAPVVIDQWNRDQWYNQMLVDRGFLVAKVDNRSATAISKTLENTVARLQAGDGELNDLVDAVGWFKRQTYVDADRVGVWGWSGGGTFTLLAMSRSAEFKAGISVAPVTDWHYYDTKYGEATMKTPSANPEGYAKTSLPQYARNLHGRLLLVHGTYDDNVHPQNTWHFADELIGANIPFDMMIYPMRKHSISDKPARIHLFNKMIEFWQEHLAR